MMKYLDQWKIDFLCNLKIYVECVYELSKFSNILLQKFFF